MEQIYFKVKSTANFVNLACTILFENGDKLKEFGGVWHEVFSGEAGDQLFQGFMEELFPEGCTITEKELMQLMNKAIRFLETDIPSLEIKAKHDKRRFPYYVYFEPLHKVFPCGFGEHEDTVIRILTKFIGESIIEYQTDKLKRFIRDSFEIRSDNTSIERLIDDLDYIQMGVYSRANRRF